MQAILAVIRWALLVALALLRWVGLVTAWCRDFVAFSTQETVTADTINCERALLPKVPTHIAFILNGADSSIVDVGRLLAWSFSLDIRYVTVFDRNGMFSAVINTVIPVKIQRLGRCGTKPIDFERSVCLILCILNLRFS